MVVTTGRVIAAFLVTFVFAFFVGYVVGNAMQLAKSAVGRIVIDKTGETERWTYIFDKPLDYVVKQKFVLTRIEVKE